jgi:hypothetical protein
MFTRPPLPEFPYSLYTWQAAATVVKSTAEYDF